MKAGPKYKNEQYAREDDKDHKTQMTECNQQLQINTNDTEYKSKYSAQTNQPSSRPTNWNSRTEISYKRLQDKEEMTVRSYRIK
jgi:hypothetical protein